MKFKIIFCLFILISLISVSSAFNITTDEITETSIIWNLTDINTNITSIALDGIFITGYMDRPTQIVQNNLYEGETHIISVLDDEDNITTGTAKTITPISQSENLAENLNLYFLFVLGIICLFIGFGNKLIAFCAGCIGVAGLLISLNSSFTMIILFVIVIVASCLECIDF